MFKTKREPFVSRYRFLYRRPRMEVESRLDGLVALLGAQDDNNEHAAWLASRWRAAIVNMIDSGLPAGRRYRLSQLTILFGGLAVPVFASFNAASASPPTLIRYLVLGLSLFVGLATALQQAYRYREGYEDNWRTAGSIEAEAWAFLYRLDPPYQGVTDNTELWRLFVRRVEHMLTDWNERVISDQSKAATPPPPPSTEATAPVMTPTTTAVTPTTESKPPDESAAP